MGSGVDGTPIALVSGDQRSILAVGRHLKGVAENRNLDLSFVHINLSDIGLNDVPKDDSLNATEIDYKYAPSVRSFSAQPGYGFMHMRWSFNLYYFLHFYCLHDIPPRKKNTFFREFVELWCPYVRVKYAHVASLSYTCCRFLKIDASRVSEASAPCVKLFYRP